MSGNILLILSVGLLAASVAFSYKKIKLGSLLFAAAGLPLLSAVSILIISFLSDDFSFAYVASHSAAELPTTYKISALWAGEEGSLLLWAFFMWLFLFIFVLYNKRVSITGSFFTVLFILYIIIRDNPFAGGTISHSPLSPLLVNGWMAIHPPIIFAGYAAASLPFIFLTDRYAFNINNNSVSSTKAFPLFFIATGVVFGGAWAYETSGWGGYWSWDPVENGSLSILLAALALFFCKADDRKTEFWSAALLFATTLMTAFITRSGLFSLQSVHSFTSSGSGFLFIVLILTVILLLFALTFKVKNPTDKIFSSYFSITLLLLSLTIITATFLPIITGIYGKQFVFGSEFFSAVSAPFLCTSLFFLFIQNNTQFSSQQSTNVLIIFLTILAAAATGFVLSDNTTARIISACAFATMVFAAVSLGTKKVQLDDTMKKIISATLCFFVIGVVLTSYNEDYQKKIIPLNGKIQILDFDVSFSDANPAQVIISNIHSRKRIDKMIIGSQKKPAIMRTFFYDLIITPEEIFQNQSHSPGLPENTVFLNTSISVISFTGILRIGSLLLLIVLAANLILSFREKQ